MRELLEEVLPVPEAYSRVCLFSLYMTAPVKQARCIKEHFPFSLASYCNPKPSVPKPATSRV